MEEASRQAVISALKTVSALKLVPPVCPGAFEGSRTGRSSGGAMEFADYRFYRQGDELKRIDWKIYARNEQLMVRRFAQETDPRCDILIDCTSSMGSFGKAAAAAGIAAMLAQSAVNAGFSLQVWALCGEPVPVAFPGEPLLWQLPEPSFQGDIQNALEQVREELFCNGTIFLISDLLFSASPGRVLEPLRKGSCSVIQILGKEELEFGFSGAVTLTDPETGEEREIWADPQSRARYRERLRSFQEQWAANVRAQKGNIFFFNASELLAAWPVESFFREGIFQ